MYAWKLHALEAEILAGGGDGEAAGVESDGTELEDEAEEEEPKGMDISDSHGKTFWASKPTLSMAPPVLRQWEQW